MKYSLVVNALLLSTTIPVFGQAVAGFGGISGVVRDPSGAVIPNAQVVVSNESKGIRRALNSNASGVFSAPALVPADGYRVEVQAPGFVNFDTRGISILVGQTMDLAIVMQIGTAATEVQVTDVAGVVESTKTDTSQVVDSRQILNLPINGRRVDSFVLLTPAVVADGTFGLVSFRGIAGGNAFLTDGNDTTNNFYNENAGRTRITTQISQDAVQEFEVKTSGYSAEFGRASGGVINTVTRSGGNEMHGTGYWFFRNRSLNARDPYSTFNPPEVRHQAGGSIGGPVKKDRLFYFFNGETTRRRFPLIASMTRPPLFNPDGTFVNPGPATSQCTASAAQCEAARRFFDRQFGTLPRTANSELLFGKLDYRPNDRNSISASFNYLRWISPLGIQTQAVLNTGAGVGNNADSTVRTRYGRLSWTSIPSNTMVNEVRFGWFKDRLFDDFNPSLVPALTGPVSISVQGQTNVGVADAYPRLNPSENRYQLADNLTWTLGKHTLKVGVDFVHTLDYNDILRGRFGSYNYATFSNFALDLTGNTTGAKRWQTYAQRFGNPVAETWIRDYNFYVQDQFRITPKLTFNYGLRYEYATFSQPKLVNPDYSQTGRIPQPGKNWAPLAGIAYSLKSKTVIRAGYGLFYARFQGGLVNTFFLENGLYQRNISLNAAVAADLAAGPVFPRPLPALDRNPPAGTVDVTFAAPNFRNPYTQQGDIAIERELMKGLGLTVNYVWSRGKQLTTARDLNIGALGPDVTYRILDVSNAQVGTYTTPTYRLANRVDPRWRRVNQVENGGLQWYDGLVVQLNKRMSKTVQGSVSYTWSHAIDLNQGGGNDNIFFSTGPRSLFNGDYRLDKSSSSLDQRHRFVGSFVYAPVIAKYQSSAMANHLVNGWQLSGIVTLASAQPQTPTIFVSGNPFAGAAFNNSLNGFGGSTRVPFLPAASLPIDQIYRMDARLTKILAIKEKMNLQLNFEAFNVWNHVSDTAVNGQAFQATNGALTPTARLGEGSASQGFPDGTNARRAQVGLRFVF